MSATHKASHHNGPEGFTSDMGDLREGFNHLRSDVNDLLKSAVDAGQSGVAAAVKGVKQKGSDSLESLGEQIAERPFTSVLIAMAAGYLLAKWRSR